MRPFIGIPCDVKQIGLYPFHVVGEKYIHAVMGGAGAVPVLIPALGDPLLLEETLSRLDGVLLTGSVSNVEPHRYGGAASRPGTLHDSARDATTLPLIQAALARNLPVLGICRGFQEMNVALGGALYQHVQEEPAKLDHREPSDVPLDIMYGPVHRVDLSPDGWLASWLGETQAQVNSLHQQGVQRLAPGMVVEAVAEDGLIEAFRHPQHDFLLAVQWHPEWKYQQNPLSQALFGAFGDACRVYMNGKVASMSFS